MKKIVAIMMLYVAFCLVGCSGDSEEGYTDEYYEEEREYSTYVDVAALESIAEQDTFELKITDTDYEEDCFVDNGDGDDNAIFYIQNNSSEPIVEFQFYVVAYAQDLSKTLFRDSEDVTWYTLSDIYIGPGDEYVLEVCCHGDEFYDFIGLIRNYKTEAGEFCENELGEEWYDIALYGTGENPEVTFSTPPEEEYDGIVESDDRYFLCKKHESGFEEDTTLYGLYDGETGKWATDFMDLGEQVNSFYNNGEGVFSYLGKYFMSADYGGVFKLDTTYHTSCEEIFFNGGKAFVFIDSDDQGARDIPDVYMYRVSTVGELEGVEVPGCDKDECFWVSANVVDPDDEIIYARVFRRYTDDDDRYCIYVYMYETGESLVIDVDKYYDNMNLSMGVVDYNTCVSYDGEYIRVENLDGADGESYYVEYDLEGNLITEPTLM